MRRFREQLQILGTLFVIGLFVFGAIFVGLKSDNPDVEPAMRVEMWCTGYAAGFTHVMMKAGFQPPFSNEWEALVQQCTDGIFYLDKYPIQKGISPPNPQEIFWDDVAPAPEGGACLPSILRQC